MIVILCFVPLVLVAVIVGFASRFASRIGTAEDVAQ